MKNDMKTKFAAAMLLAGVSLMSAGCKKESGDGPSSGKDAVARIWVHDDKGAPIEGVSVLIFDEKGYERFEKDRNTQPADRTKTRSDGRVEYRLPYATWLKQGNRFVTFVIYEKRDMDNYRIWAIGRTIVPGKKEQIEFTIESSGPTEEPAETPQGMQFDMYDENHGRTLFGEALYLDAEHRFAGADRYSLVDAGPTTGVDAIGALRLDGFTDRIAAQPRHGYFICKDISLQEFPSGKWALSVAAEYIRAYIPERLYKDQTPVGVRIYYTLHKPEEHGLPQWKQRYKVSLAGERSLVIDLQGIQGSREFAARKSQTLEFIEEAGQGTVQIIDPNAARGNSYPFYIRSGTYYTEVSIEMTD